MGLPGRRAATNAPTVKMAISAANNNGPMSLAPGLLAMDAAPSTARKYRPKATNKTAKAHTHQASRAAERLLTRAPRLCVSLPTMFDGTTLLSQIKCLL